LPEVYTNRANDPNWFPAMTNELRKAQDVAKVGEKISMQMTQHVERVKATLPEDADEEALQMALALDETWAYLMSQKKAQEALAEKTWADSRELVRAKIVEEMQAQQDVKAGRAKAKDTPRERPALKVPPEAAKAQKKA
jgi:hypothetical protein